MFSHLCWLALRGLTKNNVKRATLTVSSGNAGQWRSISIHYPIKQEIVKVVTRDELVTNLISKVKTTTGQNIMSNHSSYDKLVLSLIESHKRTRDFDNLLKEEITSNINAFQPIFLPRILSALQNNKCMSRRLLEATSERVHKLIEQDLEDLPFNYNFGRFFYILGKSYIYNEPLCNSLQFLLTHWEEALTPWMIGNVAWYCARVKYYNPSLLDKITTYTLQNIERFPRIHLSNVVYSLGQLNYSHAELMDAVGEMLESERPSSDGLQVYWVYMWTSLVGGVIRRAVATRLLDNQFIERSMGNGVQLTLLLQLSIAFNYQYKDLGLSGTKSWPNKWGQCFDSLHNVDERYIQQASLDRLHQYRTGGSKSVFSENVKRALSQILGEDFFTSEAISLSGYIMDFEILLDSNNKPVQIPRRWKKQWRDTVIKSIDPAVVRVRKSVKKVSSLIENLENAETDTKSEATNAAILDSKFDLRMRVNLASDWGSKFEALPTKVVKRVAIEVDGVIHFAANCDHPTGKTVLKHRQLHALGWEVLQIPYQEWEGLPDGDAHVNYLVDKIFRT